MLPIQVAGVVSVSGLIHFHSGHFSEGTETQDGPKVNDVFLEAVPGATWLSVWWL